jgi:hypothetical protein
MSNNLRTLHCWAPGPMPGAVRRVYRGIGRAGR